jgi:3-oxoadipate enol-lactonase
MNVLSSGDAILHYQSDRVSPDVKTIVFINSLGTDFRIWDDVTKALGQRYNVILHDKRGHGLSALRDAAISIATYADDLEHLLKHLGAQHIILCGLSVGGLIAQELMQRGRLDLRGIILSNTGLKIGTDTMWNSRIEGILRDGLDAMSHGVMERWFSPAFRQSQPDMVSLYRTMLARTSVEGYLACCKALRDAPAFDHSEMSRKLPALCIAGSLDGSTPPAVVKALADNIPQADYFEFDGVGHLPCIEQPQRYAKVLSDFVDGI